MKKIILGRMLGLRILLVFLFLMMSFRAVWVGAAETGAKSKNGDFQEIDGEENSASQTKAVAETVKSSDATETSAEEVAVKKPKCAGGYDYNMKKKILDLRMNQANLRYKRVVETTEYLVVRFPNLAQEKRADSKKEVDQLSEEIKKLEETCGGTQPSSSSNPAGGNPKDSAPAKKP